MQAIQIHPRDTVAVAVEDLAAGTSVNVSGRTRTLVDAIPAGHKFALGPHDSGDAVVKYGYPIGRATAPIAPGVHVHTHNLRTALAGDEAYRYDASSAPSAPTGDGGGPTFQGYRRADGRVGTRNEIWVLNTVGCVNHAAQQVARLAERRFAHRLTPIARAGYDDDRTDTNRGDSGTKNGAVLDGVHAFPHPFGCSQLGDDLQYTQRVLASLLRHPNAGGVVLLGLGCENNQLDALLDAADDLSDGPFDRSRLRTLTAQMVGNEIEAGLDAVADLLDVMADDRREPCPASDLVLGLKCGGSDGFSGITANPLVGRIADRLTNLNGAAVLTEVPEMFGAERVLMQRAVSRTVFDDVVAMINDFKGYFRDHGQPIYENPSPGNKDGGLTTLEEKSLGAIQKGGTARVTEVIRYGERLPAGASGLILLESPGNDGVSATALTAAGATVLLFTTGRGTPLGFPAPTVKIATNTALADRKPHWIDFDAGRLLAGDASDGPPNERSETLDTLADALFEQILAVASGTVPTNNERYDVREIAIWKHGVTL